VLVVKQDLGVRFFVFDGFRNPSLLPRPHRIRVRVRHPGAVAAVVPHWLVGVLFADPASHDVTLALDPNWRPGDTISLGIRTLRVVAIRDDDAESGSRTGR
jgi:hypothetical protein